MTIHLNCQVFYLKKSFVDLEWKRKKINAHVLKSHHDSCPRAAAYLCAGSCFNNKVCRKCTSLLSAHSGTR